MSNRDSIIDIVRTRKQSKKGQTNSKDGAPWCCWHHVSYVFAAIATWLFVVQYQIWAKSAREISLDANEPTIGVVGKAAFNSDLEFRKKMRLADKNLLRALDERKAKFDSQPPSKKQREAHVDDYYFQLQEILDSTGPEAGPLMEDIREKMEDPDLEAMLP